MARKTNRSGQTTGERGPATIVDVARLAQVSVGTVSNVLNGTREVSEVRRKRVLKAIEELGFQQNLLAQGLRRRLSSVVGLCVPLTSTSYFAALVDAFEEVAWRRSFAIMQVLTRQDPLIERQRIEELLRYRVGGLLLVPSISPQQSYELIAASGVPLVVVDRPMRSHPVDQVVFANRQAMYELGGQLIELGHRRILFCVQQPHLSVTLERREGLNRAISEAPHPVSARLLVTTSTEPAFLEQVRLEMQSPTPPTAIIVSNSVLAAWMVRAVRKLGVSCPDQVSLVSFGEPDWAELVTPTLSVVRQPTHEIAVRSWELLIRRMNGDRQDPQFIELEGQLIMRESVCAPKQPGPPPQRPEYC